VKREADGLPATRARVEWTARQIHDPVWRLRYLQSLVRGTPTHARWRTRKIIGLLALSAVVLVVAPLSIRSMGAVGVPPPEPAPLPVPRLEPARIETVSASSAQVWQVEKTEDFETYSNGLRIENQFAVGHRPRAYVALSYGSDGTGGEHQTDPV